MKKFFAILIALVLMLAMTGTALAASITIQPNVPNSGATSAGETYNAYKILDATIAANAVPGGAGTGYSYSISESNPFYEAVQGLTSYFSVVEIASPDISDVHNVQFVGIASESSAKAIATALKAAVDSANPAITPDGTTTANGTANAVIDDLDPGYYLVTSSLGSALVLDTLGDATIATKNSYPSIEKTVDQDTAHFGATLTYTITVTIPDTAVGDIIIHDTLTNATFTGLTADSLEVTEVSPGDSNLGFKISAAQVADAIANGGTAVIKYTATVDANATEITNEAFLTYSQFTSKEVAVTTTNYKVDINKYTGTADNRTGLAGAGFKLKDADEKYYKNTNGVVTWVEDASEATEYITSEEGNYSVTFAGLANGSYMLSESTVPHGYNKINAIEIVINNQNAVLDVMNSTGPELPSTGGIGTTVFYVVGGILVLAALVLLITRRKTRTEK